MGKCWLRDGSTSCAENRVKHEKHKQRKQREYYTHFTMI